MFTPRTTRLLRFIFLTGLGSCLLIFLIVFLLKGPEDNTLMHDSNNNGREALSESIEQNFADLIITISGELDQEFQKAHLDGEPRIQLETNSSCFYPYRDATIEQQLMGLLNRFSGAAEAHDADAVVSAANKLQYYTLEKDSDHARCWQEVMKTADISKQRVAESMAKIITYGDNLPEKPPARESGLDAQKQL